MWSFTTDAATLRKVLEPHQFLHPNQSPIEWHTLLEEAKSGVSLTTTNHTLTFNSNFDVKVVSDHDEFLTITFPTLKVVKYLRELGSEVITIAWSEFKLEINSISGFVVFETGDPSEFSIDWTMDAKKGSFEVDPKSLLDALRFVEPAVSHEIMRPVLNTIFMERLTESKLAVVATNGHILGWTRISFKGVTAGFRFVTDGLAVKFLTNYFPIQQDEFAGVVTFMNTITEVDPMKVSWGENRTWFEHNECILMVRNPDGQYPKYQNVIPEPGDSTIFLKKNVWLPLLKQMLASMDSEFTEFLVTLNFSEVTNPDRITMVDYQNSEHYTTMFGGYQGTIFNIHFNIKYLIQIIKAFPDQDIRINLTGEKSAAIVTVDSAPDDYLYLIMPCGD